MTSGCSGLALRAPDSVAAGSGDSVAFRLNGAIVTNRSGTLEPWTFVPPTGVTSVQFLGEPDIGAFNLASAGSNPIVISINYLRGGPKKVTSTNAIRLVHNSAQ